MERLESLKMQIECVRTCLDQKLEESADADEIYELSVELDRLIECFLEEADKIA